MSQRKDVSVSQNLWHDSQRVDQSDMETEQNFNNESNAAILQNHFGSGVLISSPKQAILFDTDNLNSIQASLLAAGNFDGTGLDSHSQPTDINLGNQLEVELTNSEVWGRKAVKVVIIGLSFDDTMQQDKFYFYRNGKQVTSKHYKKILTIFTNDFKGNNLCSEALGGRIVIKETSSFQLSRDPIMVANDAEPDLFWRDFKIADGYSSLSQVIQAGIGPEYSFDGLDINVYGKFNRELVANDVTTKIGQKFKALTNNIQKITLLLGVSDDVNEDIDNQFNWEGDLVVSVYPLQTSTVSPSDIVPELAIDFDPSNVPLAQISYNQNTLREYGYVLTNVLQPVDFVFNSTIIGSGSAIEPNKYYAVTVTRSGAAITGTILIGQGNDRVTDSHVTLFNGIWVDVPEDDLWFQIWTDAAKVADGQGYDAGYGILYPKTDVDSETGALVDYQARYFNFNSTGESVNNIAIIEAAIDESVSVQDERTGNPVFSRKKYVPSVSFVTESALKELKETSDPLVIGCLTDTNSKINPDLIKTQTYPGLAKNNQFIIINPDSDLLSLNLLGSNFYPNAALTELYKIFKVTLCVDGYGDVNGDGYIDASDVVLATTLIGESIHLQSTQQKILDGYFSTLEVLRADVDGDGYVTSDDIDLLSGYVNKSINGFPVGTSFTHMTLKLQPLVGRYDGYFDCGDSIRLDGYSGLNVIDPEDLTASELVYYGFNTPINLTSAVPFVSTDYKIIHQPFWQGYLVGESSSARQVPASFTLPEKTTIYNIIPPATSSCKDRNEIIPESDPGRNDVLFPDNLYIGKGELLRPDGSYYAVDFEVGTIILQLPDSPLDEAAINIFDKFVADNGNGFTRVGYPAMKFADGSTVQDEDLARGRVKFNVAIQAFYPQLDGYNEVDGYGIIVDNIIGCYMDQGSGILQLSIKDLAVDEVLRTLVTKIQIDVYLKKAGWKNAVPLIVTPSEILGLVVN